MRYLKETLTIEYSIVSIGYDSAQSIHKARIYVKLKPVKERTISQLTLIEHYREKMKNVQDLVIAVEKVDDFDTGGTTAPLQVVLMGDRFEVLDDTSTKLMDFLKSTPGIVDVDRDYESGKPEMRISILRENAQRVGVSVKEIAAVLGSAYSSDSAISYYEDNGKQFDITVRFRDDFRTSLEDLKKLQVKNANGEFVALEGLIAFEDTLGTASINRFDRERKILVTASTVGLSLDQVVVKVEEKMKEILPEGYHYRFTGDVVKHE